MWPYSITTAIDSVSIGGYDPGLVKIHDLSNISHHVAQEPTKLLLYLCNIYEMSLHFSIDSTEGCEMCSV